MDEAVVGADVGQRHTSVSAGRSRAVGVALLIGTATSWSLAGLFVKTLALPPLTFTFYRSLLAAGAMSLGWLATRGARPNGRWMACTAGVFTVSVLTFVTATTFSTAAMAILLQYTGPFFCALLAWTFQRRRIDRGTAAAMTLAAAGIGIMILGNKHPVHTWLGPVCGLVSGFSFGALILMLEKVDRASGGKTNPLAIVALNNLGCVVLLLPVAIYYHQLAIAPRPLAWVTAAGLVQTSLPYVLFQLALRRVPPVDASLLILLEPVLNPLWVALFTTERPTAATIFGGGFILVALVIEAVKKR